MKRLAQSEIRPPRNTSPDGNDPESNKVIGIFLFISKSESIKIQNVKFMTEKDYLKDPKCKICCSVFGNL